ncbi:MAG TPA: hypothetical protein EYM32_05510 [Dehalococcoidia bacterium]|nr:hypothetical protein [Dehalococcoidia bacterium]
MYKYIFLAALLPLALIIVACTTEIEVEKIVEVTGEVPVSSATVATEPRELNLLVGSGRDTEAILQFFPRNLTVKVGDSVTWKIDTDEIHTVAFLPEGAPVPPFPAPIESHTGRRGFGAFSGYCRQKNPKACFDLCRAANPVLWSGTGDYWHSEDRRDDPDGIGVEWSGPARPQIPRFGRNDRMPKLVYSR